MLSWLQGLFSACSQPPGRSWASSKNQPTLVCNCKESNMLCHPLSVSLGELTATCLCRALSAHTSTQMLAREVLTWRQSHWAGDVMEQHQIQFMTAQRPFNTDCGVETGMRQSNSPELSQALWSCSSAVLHRKPTRGGCME